MIYCIAIGHKYTYKPLYFQICSPLTLDLGTTPASEIKCWGKNTACFWQQGLKGSAAPDFWCGQLRGLSPWVGTTRVMCTLVAPRKCHALGFFLVLALTSLSPLFQTSHLKVATQLLYDFSRHLHPVPPSFLILCFIHLIICLTILLHPCTLRA